MRHSPKNINPKKLNLSEMWEGYQLLRVGDMTGNWMADIGQILENTSDYRLERFLKIAYKDISSINDGLALLLAVTKVVTRNRLELFDSFLKVLRS